MKVLKILVFLIIGATSVFSQTGWFRLNSGVKETLNDISFCDSLHGIAFGTYSGTAITTTDGGEHWTKLLLPDTLSTLWVPVRAIFITDTSGFLLVKNLEPNLEDTSIYHLYYTSDKGVSWQERNPTPHDLSERSFHDMTFPSPNIGYIIGDSSARIYILKTINGGKTWNKIHSLSGWDPSWVNGIGGSLIFRDSIRGIASLYKTLTDQIPTYYYTLDGGNSWKEFTKPNNPYCESSDGHVYFGYSKTNRWFYAGYDSSKILFNDHGLESSDWDSTPAFLHYRRSICWGKYEFYDSQIGYVAQLAPSLTNTGETYHGNIYKTTDGGDNWIVQETNTNVKITAVSAPTKNIAYGVGDSGTIIKTIDGGGPKSSVLIDKSENTGLSIWPNPASTIITVAIEAQENLKTISIINALGEEVMRKHIPANSSSIEIDLNELQAGAYTVIAGSDSRKIIKQ